MFSSNIFPLSLNAERAPQLKAGVGQLLSGKEMKIKRFFLRPFVLGITAAVVLGFSMFHFWVYHNNPVVLEVHTDCRGMTYPSGLVLDFRLYQSGRLPGRESFHRARRRTSASSGPESACPSSTTCPTMQLS